MSSVEQPTAPVVPPESIAHRVWRTISIFLPPPLREVTKEGLLPTLTWIVVAITVVPLLTAFLAAFWLSVIKHYVGLDFVQSMRNSYVRSIQEGFSMDELVARKLDYVQFIGAHLEPNSAPVNFPMHLERRQQAKVTLTSVWDTSPDNAACRYQDVDRFTRLVVVRIGGQKVLECEKTEKGECSRTLDAAWWDRIGPELPEGMPWLTIARADAVANVCAEVEVEGRVTVYKNVYR